MSLISDMANLSTALCASEAFQDWVGADDASEAADYVFLLTTDRDLSSKTTGYNCAVISQGTGFNIRRVDMANGVEVTPEFDVEFFSLIDKDTADSVAFSTLQSDVNGILSELWTQSTFIINDVSLKTGDDPGRAKPSITQDFVSLTLVMMGDEWQHEI